MGKLMFQLRKQGTPPSLDEVCSSYDLRPSDVDPDYGVVQTDTREGLYVVLVDETAQARLETALQRLGLRDDPAVGVFSNPRIEPCGPPQDDRPVASSLGRG